MIASTNRFPLPRILTAPYAIQLRAYQVVASLFAGYDTTTATLARVLQLLGSADSKHVIHQLVQELSGAAPTGKTVLKEGTENGKEDISTKGILGAFPLLDAIVHESYR